MDNKINQHLIEGENFYALKKFDEALESFKEALLIDAEDQTAKYGIAKSLNDIGYQVTLKNDIAQAHKYFTDAVNTYANFPLAHSNLGFTFLKMEDHEHSWQSLEKAFSQDPELQLIYGNLLALVSAKNEYTSKVKELLLKKTSGLPEYWFALAFCSYILKEYDQACEYYKKAIGLKPDDERAYSNLSLSFKNAKKQTEAVIYFKELVEKDPQKDVFVKQAPVWFNLASFLYDIEKYKESFDCYKKAIAIRPDYKDAYDGLRTCFHTAGENEVAVSYFEDLIKSDPQKDIYIKQVEVWFNLAYFSYYVDKFDESSDHYKKVISLKPEYKEAYNNIKLNFEKVNRLKDCVAYFKNLLENDPQKDVYNKQPELWFALGSCFYEMEQYEEAISCYKTAITLKPNYDVAYYDLRHCFEKTGKTEESILFFKLILETHLHQVTYSYLMFFMFLSKKLEDAIAYSKEICKKNIDFKEPAYMNILYYNNLIDKDDDTIIFFNSITEKNKKDLAAHRCLGYAYGYKRQFANELEQQEKALKISSTAEGYYELGNAHMNNLHYKDAIDCFEKAIEMDNDFIYAKHNKNYILERQGRYKESSEGWRILINEYDRILKYVEPVNIIKKSEAWAYLADIYFYGHDLSELDKAKDAFVRSMTIDEENMLPVVGLVKYYAEKKTQIVDRRKTSENTTDDSHGEYIDAHMNMYNYFFKAESKLQQNLGRYENKYDMYQLGELYLITEQYENAKKYFSDCIKKYPAFSKGYVGLGVTNMRTDNYKDAIDNFKRALDFEIDDINIRANLGEAYLKNKNFDSAEKTYRDILRICPKSIDAIMGTAEYYKIMGDKALEDKNVSDAEDWYQRALTKYNQLDEIINTKSPASRRINRTDVNNIYYSRGYIKVKLYEIGNKLLKKINLKSIKLFSLQSPLEDFKKILPGEDNYLKARTAIQKINKEISIARNFAKKGAPLVIIVASFLILLFTQYAFFIGRKETKPDSYSINFTKFATFAIGDSILRQVIPKLATHSKKEFTSKDVVSKLIDSLSMHTLKDTENFVLINNGKHEEIHLSETSYGLFTFSSLVFLIIGFFLAEITKLKVGSIELEKSVIDTASTTPSLNIK